MNKIYKISAKTLLDNGVQYTLQLNQQHIIYQVHFPQNPITPGAYLIQICQELFNDFFGKNCPIAEIKNLKFTNMVRPTETTNLEVKLLFDADNKVCKTQIFCEKQNFLAATFLL